MQLTLKDVFSNLTIGLACADALYSRREYRDWK